jgi:hypothetical protein
MCNRVYLLLDCTCRQLENERAASLEKTRILEERHQRELEDERAAAAERTRILKERLQRELENEREAAVERIRILEERLQRESQIVLGLESRSQSLEAENSRLNEFVLLKLLQLDFLRTIIYLLLLSISEN